ncbi:hexose transporter [Scheffersomyces xylosifermentans]|uniref:hexose transporter n=1 Tax=Scheffersomyces xylosifermentans TaxID=1304137 RepID=UPI00315C6831
MWGTKDNKENNNIVTVTSKENENGSLGLEEQRELTLEDVTPKLTKWWFQYPHLLHLNVVLGCASLAQVTLGYDGSMMGNLQTLPSWSKYFNNPHGQILSTMTNGITIGAMAATPLLTASGDRLKRKHVLAASIFLTILGAALQSASVNFGMFLGARMILGFGSAGMQVSAAPLLAETAYPSQRPIMTSMLQAAFPVGSFMAAILTWGPYQSDMKYNNWSWRLPSLLQAVVPLLQAVLVCFCPESPRWLIAHGREDEAFEILTKFHAGGDRDSELVRFEIAEISAAISREKIGRKISWMTWFASKANMHRLFITLALPSILQLCGSSLIAYYFSIVLQDIGITEPSDKLKINIGLTLFGGVCALVFAVYSAKWRRKLVMQVSLGGMCIIFIIWIVLADINEKTQFKNKALGRGIIALLYFDMGFYHAFSPIGNTYVMEIVPYTLRGKASILYSLASQVWIFYNNYVNNLGMDSISWRYYIVYCVLLFTHMVVIHFWFPETKGLGLEEVAKIFGEDISDLMFEAQQAIAEPANLGKRKVEVNHIEDASVEEEEVDR